MSCLVKCRIVTRSNSQNKGADTNNKETQKSADQSKDLSYKSKTNENACNRNGKEVVYPMPSCSFHGDRSFYGDHRPQGHSQGQSCSSFISRRILTDECHSCPNSLPSSAQGSPNHNAVRLPAYKMGVSQYIGGSGLPKLGGSALTRGTDGERSHSSSPPKSPKSPSVSRVSKVPTYSPKSKPRHHSFGENSHSITESGNSPPTTSKSKFGKGKKSDPSRRHTIGSTASPSYPSGGFRHLAGFSSLQRGKKKTAERETKKPDSPKSSQTKDIEKRKGSSSSRGSDKSDSNK